MLIKVMALVAMTGALWVTTDSLHREFGPCHSGQCCIASFFLSSDSFSTGSSCCEVSRSSCCSEETPTPPSCCKEVPARD